MTVAQPSTILDTARAEYYAMGIRALPEEVLPRPSIEGEKEVTRTQNGIGGTSRNGGPSRQGSPANLLSDSGASESLHEY